jgi:hypothetical protein
VDNYFLRFGNYSGEVLFKILWTNSTLTLNYELIYTHIYLLDDLILDQDNDNRQWQSVDAYFIIAKFSRDQNFFFLN